MSKMIINVDYEDSYIHYLKQLLVIKDIHSENVLSLDKFTIIHVNELNVVSKHVRKKTTKQEIKEGKNHVPLETSKNTWNQTDELHVRFLGRHLDRVEIRRTLLENFQIYCKDEQTYEEFFNRLIDFEESVVK